MEQRIKLTSTTTFILEREEKRRLYTSLALSQYRYLRYPSYNEQQLLESLEKKFKRFYTQIQQQAESDPNNLILHQIRCFFDMHYCQLKELNEKGVECRE